AASSMPSSAATTTSTKRVRETCVLSVMFVLGAVFSGVVTAERSASGSVVISVLSILLVHLEEAHHGPGRGKERLLLRCAVVCAQRHAVAAQRQTLDRGEIQLGQLARIAADDLSGGLALANQRGDILVVLLACAGNRVARRLG